MTPDDLVLAVRSLATAAVPVATSKDIEDWCDSHQPPIPYNTPGGGPTNDLFWNADLKEATGANRLQKYKRGRRTALNASALVENVAAADAWARADGWLKLPWDAQRGTWDWRKGVTP